MISLRPAFTALAVASVVLALLFSTASSAVTDRVVYDFTGGADGGNAATALVFDSVGNAYGTTVTGGGFGCGTVFKLTPAAQGFWKESVLWNFSCFGDGKNPHGGVTLHNGALYGTTVAGGAGGICAGDGCGVVFKLVPGVTLHVLYNFRGGNDGFGPGGAVAFDRAGNLYGTTPDGGVYQHGTVYELKHLSGGGYRYAIIHNFTGGSDGATGSLGALLVDASGDLFGVTETGGPHGAGTAYEMTPQSGGAWHFTTIYPFSGAPNAGFPYGGLVADANGNLYGTTYYAGKFGFGSVFELSPTATTPWKERLLHSFKAGSDGSSPTSTPAFDPKGNLFGTTSAGGTTSCDCGTVFRIDRTTGNESIVHVFGASGDGSYPYYGLTAYGSRFYSSTVAGGLYGQGTIFSVAQ